MSEEIVKRPCVVVGLLVENDAHQFLMVRGTKWEGKFFIPGGKVEWGETIEQAARRELKEETGLAIDSLEFVTLTEVVLMPEYNPNKHHVTLVYRASTSAKPSDVELEERELTECAWLTVDEILARTDIVGLDHTIFETLKNKMANSGSADEYKAGWQRALADYKNLQKEVNDKKSEWAHMSEQFILEEFIPVYDNFKKAFSHHPDLNADEASKKIKNWIDGIGYIQKQFWDVLKVHQIEEVKTVGEKFDPKLHETVGEEEGMGEPGTIVREVDGGYTMGGRVIKVARVIVVK